MEERRGEGRREEDARLYKLVQETHDTVVQLSTNYGQIEHDVRGLEDDFKSLNWKLWGIAGTILAFLIYTSAGFSSDNSSQDRALNDLGRILERVTSQLDSLEDRMNRHEIDYAQRKQEYIAIVKEQRDEASKALDTHRNQKGHPALSSEVAENKTRISVLESK